MPIYEYTCGKCGAHLEVMQKISDKPLARHARCGGKLSKEWSQTSFQLKGSGWYVTDYAGKKETKEAKESTESSGAEAKKETKETKAETPSPTTKDKQKPKASAATAAGD